jgi:hypothetical protein
MIAALLVAGCANGPIYWTRAGATEDVFLTDHTPCFKTATIGYGVGNEQAYKACMQSKSWTRISGTGSQPPKVLGPRQRIDRCLRDKYHLPLTTAR